MCEAQVSGKSAGFIRMVHLPFCESSEEIGSLYENVQ